MVKTIIDDSSKNVIFSIKGNDENFYSQGFSTSYAANGFPASTELKTSCESRNINNYLYEVFLDSLEDIIRLVEKILSEYLNSRIAFTGHGSGGESLGTIHGCHDEEVCLMEVQGMRVLEN
ncbi:hypothetical protein G9A89_008477 [Geosiphon pyriformis]|nr:hypothetical protein G9A89_008477 [Geosiphon pyriformis]